MNRAFTNRLGREKSPYLLQHQHNPVAWWPWGQEAFARAKAEQKPVLLSIGYSTCHWCHVMERESFEDGATAGFLNAHFVSVKVDREERPDVDQIYMTFVHATTGQGGWPLNVFLTPDLKPFFGGTYFPPEPRQGRASFMQVLEQVHGLWETWRGELSVAAEELQARLQDFASRGAEGGGLDRSLLGRAGEQLKGIFDSRHGGFGSAPKFPQPSLPRLLLRYGERYGDEAAVRMVLETCDRMAAGGIHDQLGGGFARYSVDAEWRVPHFEKMLYDQAQLVELYLEAFLVSGQRRYAEVARDILRYVQRDLADPLGGFYSAEDADSEGHEGKFYCWTRAELASELGPEDLELAERCFGVTEGGNFIDHSHPAPLAGQNVLAQVGAGRGDAEAARLAEVKRKLLAARSRRVRPQRDDKVLASWNGLMLGALARAYAVLGDDGARVAAQRNLAFLRRYLWEPPLVLAGASGVGTLYHRWRDGEHDRVQLLEGYAFLLGGVMDLYEATLEPGHLGFAVQLADAMVGRFFDAEAGGFWQSGGEPGELILRLKPDQDGALPSGNSAAILGLLRLGEVTGRGVYRRAAEKSLALFAGRIGKNPLAYPAMLGAMDFVAAEPRRVVLAGDPGAAEPRALLRAIHSVYQPNKVVLGTDGEVEGFAKSLRGDGARAYVCVGTQCRMPTAEAAEVVAALRK